MEEARETSAANDEVPGHHPGEAPTELPIARRLAGNKDEILKRWEIRVRTVLPGAVAQTSKNLRNSVPILLDDLVEILASSAPRELLGRLNVRLARQHGIERARQKGYSLAQVIEEYQILRETLFEVLEEHEEIRRGERDLILDVIQIAVRNAASEYERLRYYERIESNHQLQLSENRYEALKGSIPGYREVSYSRVRMLAGPGLTLAAVALAEGLGRMGLPNPIYIQFLAVAVAAYFGGLFAGSISVAIVAIYAFTRFSLLEASEIALVSLGLALVIGFLRWRVFSLSRDVIQEADALLTARAATEQRLRDAHDQLDSLVQAKTAELLRNQEVFTRLVEGVKDYAIFTMDPDGYITTWNEGAVRMERYSVEEAVGRHFSMLYPEEARLRDEPRVNLANALQEGRFRGEGLRLRKNGEAFLADVLITPMYSAGKLIGFSKVVEDISERRQLMQERDISKAAVAELKRDLEERSEFVATLSHDLRNPLTSAKASAELIALRSDNGSVELAGRIVAAINRADQMIGNLLDAYRLQAGKKVQLEFAPVELQELIDTVVDEFSVSYGDRFSIRFQNRAEPGKPIRGHWNREALLRILENLLTNAVKYGDPHGRVSLTAVEGDGRVSIAVHNHGNVISPADQERLFQQYERGDTVEAIGKKGWGLGLTLVRALVEAHHGNVKVESYPKSGTTFTVDLPLDARLSH